MSVRFATCLALILAPLTASAVDSPSPLDPIREEALVNQKKKLCLDPAGEAAASRAVVALAPCDGKPDQRWRRVPVGDGRFELRNAKSGLCLDVQGYDANERDPIILYACDKKPDQYWFVGDEGQLYNGMGPIMDFNGGLPVARQRCLDIKGSDGDVGDIAMIYRCDGGTDQRFSSSATGTKTAVSGSGASTKLCGSAAGPCVEGRFTASGTTYTGSGQLALAQLPGGTASLSLDARSVTAVVGADFAVTGEAGLRASLPGPVALDLPMGAIALGYGAGITKALGSPLEIGGERYNLQPSSFYVRATTNFQGTLNVAGLTASFPVPGTRQEEFLIGLGVDGPSLYFSGDCNVVLPGIATVSSCTLGWFGARPLTHTLAVAILDPSRSLPAPGSALTTVAPKVSAAILLGGDVSFDAIPALAFSGLVAVDPGGSSLGSLSNGKLGLEGSADVGVGPFSMRLADTSLLYDAARRQVDLAAEVPALDTFKSVGAAIGTSISGEARAYGRFGATQNQLVFDFSKAKLFDFDLDKFQGQMDFQARTMAVVGRIEIGATWANVSGSFGGPDVVALSGGSGLQLDGRTLAGSRVTVSLGGVNLKGTVSMAGKEWSFDETMKTPRTIKSGVREKTVTIPLVGSASFETWAQYDVGGDLKLKGKFLQSVGGLSTAQTWDVSTDGKVDLGAVFPGVVIDVL